LVIGVLVIGILATGVLVIGVLVTGVFPAFVGVFSNKSDSSLLEKTQTKAQLKRQNRKGVQN
jgi:hypothetical protein